MKISNPAINRIRISRNDLYLVVSAFIAYTGMYAVRKSFLAGQFTDLQLHDFDFKTLLVISQVIGYMISKFIGIKIVSEYKQSGKTLLLAGLVGFGLLMLLAFYILPLEWKPLAMFLNGLPLGMVFGLVLSSLEGRKNTELLVAGLSATFIFATGFIKSVSLYLMQIWGINEFSMPFFTGLVFFPFFLLAIYLLSRCNPPSEEDKLARTERQSMNKYQRRAFIYQHGWAFAALVIIYVLLTIVRDFRDNFMVDFWAELGYGDKPGFIALTETPIAVIVLMISAAGILITNNKIAFKWSLYATILAAVLILVSTILFQNSAISSVAWMIISGTGIYLPYILFHCLIFERFLAIIRFTGTIGFLFYIADALGYLASVGILISKQIFSFDLSWVHFFTQLNIYVGIGILLIPVVFLSFQSRNQPSLPQLESPHN
ncbi:DUF5690 family protein [Membranihabitans marinus]|uniref:DUF5690 family protein n=1 Tax=Membranihabitans marinus TaxID=1227546 RepID=UPI001F189A3F|nr:DUF5690 family protein [Membranihabitans marinus]